MCVCVCVCACLRVCACAELKEHNPKNSPVSCPTRVIEANEKGEGGTELQTSQGFFLSWIVYV